VLFIREIDLEKSVRILAILSDREGSRITELGCNQYEDEELDLYLIE
jgi:hypothetical protein